MQTIRCYSRRLLNPFHGTMQVISIEHGDAESSDGVHWVLYINHEDIISHTGMFEVRYGSWSQQEGLKLSVVRGTAQNSLIEIVGEKLVRALETHAANCPFEPADFYECWMLAEDGHPLTLIETAVEKQEMQVIQSPMWHPGKAAYDNFFSNHGDTARIRHIVNNRAGINVQSLWVYRDKHRNGSCMNGSVVPAENFPVLLLSDIWQDENDEKLVSDYLQWQAPWLLQLHHLSDEARVEFEKHAWKRQLLCEKQFHLFPKVIDKQGLKITRVQARLMGADNKQEKIKEAFIDTGDKESYSP